MPDRKSYPKRWRSIHTAKEQLREKKIRDWGSLKVGKREQRAGLRHVDADLV